MEIILPDLLIKEEIEKDHDLDRQIFQKLKLVHEVFKANPYSLICQKCIVCNEAVLDSIIVTVCCGKMLHRVRLSLLSFIIMTIVIIIIIMLILTFPHMLLYPPIVK